MKSFPLTRRNGRVFSTYPETIMNKYLTFSLSAAALSLLIASSAQAAGLYKCTDGNGVPVYQNEPCPQGMKSRDMSHENSLSVVPMAVEQPKAAPAPKAASASALSTIKAGMSSDEVVAKVGEPSLTSGDVKDLTRLTYWSYISKDVITTVVFQGGKVSTVTQKAVK
jgi:hypothetical protein